MMHALYYTFVVATALFATGVSCESHPSPSQQEASGGSVSKAAETYTCPMHAQVHSDKPGKCPICHMDLVKVSGPRKIKFYRNPMNPSVHADAPTKDNMGMDYIPVYEDELQSSAPSSQVRGRTNMTLPPEQEALSGTHPFTVSRIPMKLEIETPGRVISGGQLAFQVYEQDLAVIHAGLRFTATAPSLPGAVLTGQITSVDSILDPMTRTARVSGIYSNPQGMKLRTENSVNAVIEVDMGKVIGVPEDAIVHTGTQDIVYVTDGKGSYHPQPVRLGIKAHGYYEIKEGLAAGTLISSGPNFLLDSESRIRASYDSQDH
jgi:hypothetical protein